MSIEEEEVVNLPAEDAGGDEEKAVNGEGNKTSDDNEEETEVVCIAHYKNEAHPAFLRYGIPFFLLATTILLINADIGSGISTDYILIKDGIVQESRPLFVASVVSSVKELWHNGSYPLAILIAISSIMWPYIKLLLAAYAWMMPYTDPRKREKLVEVIDALGKWSFVDIAVLVEIMVAFRSTIYLAPNLVLEIVVVAKWGFYGFVLATMMSLISTHLILKYHRQLHYKEDENLEEENGEQETNQETKPELVGMAEIGGLSSSFSWIALFAAVSAIALYLVGCFVDTYEVTNTRGEVSDTVPYSIISVGRALPGAVVDPSDLGTRFIQGMWYFLMVAMPIWCTILFGVIFSCPLSRKGLRTVFFMAEVAFAWSCAEVLLISTIFAVLQMPTFGEGLIEADCAACFTVDTQLLQPGFALLCIGTILNVCVDFWLYRKAHHALYGHTQS